MRDEVFGNHPLPKKSGKQKAIVSIVLDESGSMAPVITDTIGGFNKYIQTLKDDKEIDYEVSLTIFNSVYRVEYSRMDIKNTPLLDTNNYRPQNYTALLDAVGSTLNVLGDIPDDVKSIVVVITDGYENASKEFTSAKIREMITERDKKDNWTFVYLGAQADAWDQGGALGFNAQNIANYSHATTQAAFAGTVDATLCAVRSTSKVKNFYGKDKKF
jgi:hypothetical protein